MSMPSIRMLAVFSLLTSWYAWSADWKSSFTAKELSPFVDSEAVVLVVAAGASHTEAKGAARALEVAARARARLVMDSAALGNLSPSANDDTVRQSAAALPWTHLAVVRVFPARNSFTAVVVIYDKSGSVRASLTANPGEPAVAQATASGMSASELEGMPSTPPMQVTPGEVAPPLVVDTTPAPSTMGSADAPANGFGGLGEMDERRIHFGAVPKNSWKQVAFEGAWQGKNRLSSEQLLVALGRTDLLDARRGRTLLKMGLGIGAGLAFLGAAAGACIPQGAFGGWCQPQTEGLIVAASSGAVGVGLLAVALLLPRDSISADEMLKLIDKHNANLDSNGGVTSVQLLPVFDTRGGAGLQLSARF